MDLDSVASELYGLKPGEFTSARDARAGEARREGNRELASAIKQLKRPSVSAWLANLLVRERADEVARLLTLGQGLREAQQQLAGDQLRALSQQRHHVVSALVQEAVGLASENGQPTSAAAQRELQETLEAALSDPAAGEALRAGRLTAPLSYSGLGAQGPEAHALPTSKGADATRVRAGRDTAPDRAAEDRDRLAAVRAAEAELSAAQRRRDQQRDELERAEREHDRLARRIDELSQQLTELRAQLPRVAERAAQVRGQLDATSAQVAAAEEQVAQTRRAGT